LETLKAAGLSLSLFSHLVHVDSFFLQGVITGYKKNIRAEAILAWTPEIVAGERKVRTKSARLHIYVGQFLRGSRCLVSCVRSEADFNGRIKPWHERRVLNSRHEEKRGNPRHHF
jgi:hypothetical protein